MGGVSKGKPKNRGSSKKTARSLHDLFIRAYLAKGENGTQAVLSIKPHLTRGSAGVEAFRLLKVPYVIKEIEKYRAELRSRFSLTTDRVIQELARVSYFNPKRTVDEAGKPIPLHELEDDTAAALADIETTETVVEGKGKSRKVTTRVMKAKPFNKVTAIEKSIKILRLYDKPPPPPPEEPGKRVAEDPKALAIRLAFALAKGDAAGAKAKPAATPAKKVIAEA